MGAKCGRCQAVWNQPSFHLTLALPRRGEHTRPRVLQSAPSPTVSARSMTSGEDAKMWSARAPTTTRAARVLPGIENGRLRRSLDINTKPSLGDGSEVPAAVDWSRNEQAGSQRACSL